MIDTDAAKADYKRRVWGVTKRVLQAHDGLDLGDLVEVLNTLVTDFYQTQRDVDSEGEDE